MKKYSLILLICISSAVSAQSNKGDVEIKESLIHSYFDAAQNQATLYAGKEQVKYSKIIKNHPYLDTDEYRDGYLSFNGIEYPNVKMRLDLYKNELIAQTPNQIYNIIVPTELISHFVIDKKYIYYHYPDGIKGTPSAGFVIELYNNEYKILKKHSVTLFEQLKDREVDAYFVTSDRYYLLKDNQYHLVKNKGSVLRLFKKKKKELKALIKNQKLDFKHNMDEAIVILTAEYEKLNR